MKKSVKVFTIIVLIILIILFVAVYAIKLFVDKDKEAIVITDIYGDISKGYSQWESTDGTIRFIMDDNGLGLGEVNLNGERIEMFVYPSYKHTYIDVIPMEYYYPLNNIGDTDSLAYMNQDLIATFTCNLNKIDSFEATVVESELFEVGKKLTFVCTSRSITKEEIPYPPYPD